MEIKIVQDASGLQRIGIQWQDLLFSSWVPSITRSWEWMKTWHDVYGKNKRLFLVCGYKGDSLIGIAPFALEAERKMYFGCLPFRTLAFLGSGRVRGRGVTSDYLDFIISEGNENYFFEGLESLLKGWKDWDEIILSNVVDDSPSVPLLEKLCRKAGLLIEVIERAPSILVKLPSSWEEFLKSISGHLRYKITRGRREFSKIGGSYHLVKDNNELSKAFAALERLHQARWQSKEMPGAFSCPVWKSFHERLIPQMFNKGWIKMATLRLGTEIVAVNYNFAFNKRIHFFQSGVIPHDNKHVRLGVILHSFCIEEAIDEGFVEYDFLKIGRHGAGYKGEWENFRRDLIDVRISRKSAKEVVYRHLRGIRNGVSKLKERIIAQSVKGIYDEENGVK